MSVLTAELIVNKAVTLIPSLSSSLLLDYLRDVLRWNPQLGLVSRRDPLATCERLVLESIELLTLVRGDGVESPVRCVDVGSGAGFPGVVWALAEPEWQMLLVERKTGRAAFLQSTAVRLSLGNVEVFAGPVEEAIHQPRFAGTYHVALAMAVASPAEIGPRLEPLLAPAGRFYGTVPRNAEVPARIGKALDLKQNITGDHGNYAAYRLDRKSVV